MQHDKEQYYLAIDIGASSGRHILARINNGRIELEEIYRFPNGMKDTDGMKLWDIPELFEHIKAGLKKCADLGKIPCSLGVDTWGVDYVLLDEKDQIIGKTYGYRDSRTAGMTDEVYQIIPENELYARSGIQKQNFNTIFQLMAVKKQHPLELEAARTLLMIPDYFHFLLSGRKVQEYTNATTTQLVNPASKDWDLDLIDKLGFPRRIFQDIALPGCQLGTLTDEIQSEVGFSCNVVLPASHDTASAVAAVPTTAEDILYISSGTWSLMGTELKNAICTEESRQRNLTNEGGINYRFRYLKNIMGLWMINSAKKEIAPDMDYSTICELASKETIGSLIPVNDERFFAPDSMISEIQAYCRESAQQVPESIAQVAAVIYNSLAKCYMETAMEIEKLTGREYDCIHIVGGGSNVDYLNRLIAKKSGKKVYAGPAEATAIGNIVVQAISAGELTDLKEARKCIYDSFPIRVYQAE